jgi:hypothetical protein
VGKGCVVGPIQNTQGYGHTSGLPGGFEFTTHVIQCTSERADIGFGIATGWTTGGSEFESR